MKKCRENANAEALARVSSAGARRVTKPGDSFSRKKRNGGVTVKQNSKQDRALPTDSIRKQKRKKTATLCTISATAARVRISWVQALK